MLYYKLQKYLTNAKQPAIHYKLAEVGRKCKIKKGCPEIMDSL